MYFETIHRQISDERLDKYAKLLGLPSAVGRLSHVGDEMLMELFGELGISKGTRVLDLGCGRGFLARWFDWRGLEVDYVGVDFSETAVAAAHKLAPGKQFILQDFFEPLNVGAFDLVCAIEATGDGFVTHDLARAMLSALKPGAAALATVVSLRREFQDAVNASVTAISTHGGQAVVRDYTIDRIPSVKKLCHFVLEDDEGPEDLRRRSHEECSMFLQSIANGTYGYAAIIGRR